MAGHRPHTTPQSIREDLEMPGSPIPPPPAPPRRLELTIVVRGKVDRATLADAHDAVGKLIEHIDNTELRNRHGEPLITYVANFEVGE